MKLFTNKTGSPANVTYDNKTLIVNAGSSANLEDSFEPWQLASSNSLVQLLAQGPDKYLLNDGSKDLTAIEAINLIKGIAPTVVDLAGPKGEDNKPQMLLNFLPSWASLYYTGAGDDPDGGIGEGTDFIHESHEAGDTSHEWYFTDPVLIAGGTAMFKGAELGDYLDYKVYAPPTILSATGDVPVQLYPIGVGMNAILPAASSNQYISLTQAVPVPAMGMPGYWNTGTESSGYPSLSPAPNGDGDTMLLDFECILGRSVTKLKILGSGSTEFALPNVSAMRVDPRWKHVAKIHNSGHTGLYVVWSLMGGRGGRV